MKQHETPWGPWRPALASSIPCSYDTAATRRAAAAATASATEVAAVAIGRWQRWQLQLVIGHEGPPLGVAIEGLHGQLESAAHIDCSQLAA